MAAAATRARARTPTTVKHHHHALRPHNALRDCPQAPAKRKSAVELLQETKAFYVKSDSVLDRHQQLRHAGHLQVSRGSCSPQGSPPGSPQTVSAVGLLLSPPPSPLLSPCPSSTEPMPPAPPGFQHVSEPACTPVLPKSSRLGGATTWAQRRAATQHLQSDRLQTKLRRLLNADSKENVFYDGHVLSERNRDDTHAVAGEHSSIGRPYGRSNSQTQHSYSRACSRNSRSSQVACSLHKSLPDLHSSPAARWSDNSSTRSRESPSSSQSGEASGYIEYSRSRSGSQRGHMTHYSGDAMSVVSSGGRTHRSHRSQPAPRDSFSDLRRGGSSGSSSGTRTHRSQPEGRTRANTISDLLLRQGSGGSSAALSSNLSSWSSRCRTRTASQYHALRNNSTEYNDECDSRGSKDSRCSPGGRFSGQSSDHGGVQSLQRNSRVAELCWNFEPRRPILRSKSDISHRYSLTGADSPISPPPCQDPAQLEVFFEQLGLDNAGYRYVSQTNSHSSDSPVYFSSVSSVDSTTGGWNTPWNALGSSPGLAPGAPSAMMGSGHSGKNVEQPSIVERNARIIKWLCNCRKAQKDMQQVIGNGNLS